MNFINWLKKIYVPATCEELMAREIDTARRDLLLAATARDYAGSMMLYNNQRIERLTVELKKCLK